MDAERQRHARAIAEAAVRLQGGARTRLIEDACGADDELSSQVESLVADLGGTADTAPGADGETTHAAAARRWGPLTLLEEIGHGGFGRVFRAWDSTLAREVALKLIPVGKGDSSVAATVLREGRLLARLQHPNIVTVFGAQLIADEVGLWMEFVRGTTLADLVKRHGPFGPTEAAVIGTKLCSALGAVHQAGLVHRDVKPRNVMRAERGRIVLMDFGAGLEIAPGPDQRPEIIGTPAYMAYEVLRGGTATPASDIYSLGVLLFFLVTGAHPVKGSTFGEVRAAFERGDRRLLADLRSDLPDPFVIAVERAMARDPEARYSSAAAFRQELGRIAALDDESGEASTPHGAHTPPSARVPSSVESAATLTSSPAQLLGATAWALLLAVVAIGVMGFLASVAYDVAYGRVGAFAQESPAVWFRVGLQGMVAPAVVGLLGSLLLVGVTAVCRTTTRVSPRCRRAADRIRRGVGAAATRTALDEPLVVAAVICLAGLVAIGGVWWRFADLLALVRSPLSDAPASALQLLTPPSADQFGERTLYRLLLECLLFGLLVAWIWLLRYSRSVPGTALAVRLAPLPVVALTLLLLVVPYRILYPGEFERVVVDGARCYVIGEQPESLLLFCPLESPPRTRAIERQHPGLIRTGVWEHPFEGGFQTPT